MKKFLFTLSLLLVASSVFAWAEPTNAPPGPPGNVTAPLRNPITSQLTVLTPDLAPLLIQSSNASGGRIQFFSSGSTLRGTVGWDGTGFLVKNEDNSPLTLGTLTSPTALKILDNGNVGIGNTSPLNKLHVNGAIGANSWIGAGCETNCEGSGGYAILYPEGRLSLSGLDMVAVGGSTGISVLGNLTVAGGSSSNWAGLNVGGTNSIQVNGSIYSYGAGGSGICVGESSGNCTGTGGTVIKATGVRFPDGTLQSTAAVSGGAETDPTVLASVKDGVSWSEVTSKPNWTSLVGDLTGSYGSINVAGSNNSYGGINFSSEDAVFMVDGTGAQGIWRPCCSWDWYFDGNGTALQFRGANPYLYTGGSYFVVPNGMYISGGTLYANNQIEARGGVHNDNGVALYLNGGTNGETVIQGTGLSNYLSVRSDGRFIGSADNGTATMYWNGLGGLSLYGNGGSVTIVPGVGSGSISGALVSGTYLTTFTQHIRTPGRLYSAERTNFYLRLQNDRNMVLYDNGASVWASGSGVSDIRLKKDIVPLKSALEDIVKLSAIRFRYKDDLDDGKDHIGLIAQEVEEIYPEFVYTDETGRKLIYYDKLTAVLVGAVKELKSESDDLKKRIEALEAKVK